MKTKFSGILTLFLAFVVQLTFAQEKTISGVVTDDNGLPLPAATVLVKGTTNGTSTDFDGNYSITANTGDVLQFSYVGYSTMEKTVAASNTVSVSLVPDNELEEVVVTALGIKRKESELTSSTQNVKAEELTQAANPNVVQSLTGKVSGLQINTTNNGVNPTSKVTLRGNSSISGDNSALVVIDGVISSLGVLNNLPPEIIESVNVIKGSQGAALYGSQAANGVIIATTKGGGKKERIEVTFNSSTEFQVVNFVPQRQTKYGQGWNGGHVSYENGGWGPEFDGSLQPVGLPQADGTYKVFPYESLGNDHIKEFFKTGTTFQNSVSVNGGDETGNVLLSLSNVDTEFVVEDDVLNRTTAFFKANKKFGNWSADAAVTYYTRKQSTTSSGLFTDLLQTASNIPVTEFSQPLNQFHWTSYYQSPYWLRENVRNNNRGQYFNAVGSLTYKINDNINLLYRANITTVSADNLSYTNGYVDEIKIGGGDHTTQSRLDINDSGSRSYYGDFLANFNYDLTSDLTFGANVGFNSQDFRSTSTSVGGDNLTIPGFYNISNVTGIPDVNNFESRRRQYAVLGNFDFGFKDYLFLNLTARNDWVSTLNVDAGNESFFYPSAGLSFIPTKAFDNIKGKTINFMKVYANYAKVGRSSVGAYDINDTYVQPGGFAYGGLNSFIPSRSQTDPLIQNEFLNTIEAGFNLGFFKDRLTLDFSYYNSTTDNAQLDTTPSFTSGISTATINIGELETKGFEIDLGFTPIDNREIGLKWTNRVSFETNKTVVNKLDGQQDQVALQSFNAVGIFAEVGEEFPLIKGTAYERDDQGRVLIDPTTGNPLKTAEFQKLGVNNPDYIIGLNTQLQYKGFKLSATMDYRTGHQFWAGNKDWLSWSGHLVESAENGRRGFIFPNSAIETAPGVYEANNSVITGGTTYTSFLNYYSNEYRDVTENFVLDATAFKVRELALSYSFNGDMLKNMGIKGLTLGVNARNPFVVLPKENRDYHDPEFANSSGNGSGLAVTGQYPATKTYGVNLNLTF
jgi:TonB-linked SusC/RagA family outer membrane protein